MKYWIALAFLAAVPAVAAAPDTTVSGTWTISGDVQGTAVEESCTIVQQDLLLTGSCDTQSGKYDLKGKVDGKTVSYSHGGKYEGSDFVITYTGKLADDGTIGGTMDVDPFNVTGNFTAKKGAAVAPTAPAKPPVAPPAS